MGKIGTERIYVNNTMQEIEINFYLKRKRFIIEVPKDFQPFVKIIETHKRSEEEASIFMRERHGRLRGKIFVIGITYEEVLERFKNFILENEDRTAIITKKIVYSLDYDSKKVFSEENRWKKFDDNTVSLTFGFDVVDEYDYGEDRKKKYMKDRRDYDMPYRSTIMNYSKTAEAFFIQLKNNMEKLVTDIDKFMGSEEKVIKAIKNNTKLLGR